MWPFKRKTRDLSELPPMSSGEGEWGLAQVMLEGAPLILRYNSSARHWAKHPGLPIKLGFAMPLNTPHEGGLPDPRENEQLSDVEDAIIREVEARTPAIQVLAITNGVMKEFVFYIPPNVDIKSIHEAAQAAVSTHEVQCVAEHDPKWDTYFSFTPDA